MKILFFILTAVCPILAQEKPSILWIVSEDNSSHWIGCYGDDQAKTVSPRRKLLLHKQLHFKIVHAPKNERLPREGEPHLEERGL